MNLTVNDWHDRFSQQAGWTQHLRKYIYKRIGLDNFEHIIEVGCGTGAILSDFTAYKDKNIYGLDISEKFIRTAHKNNPKTIFMVGDGNALPLTNNHFDVALCHFFLLWIPDPEAVLREIIRIVRENGFLLILAEPDYGGRIDYPNELNVLGNIQTKSLLKQGADPFIGRRLGRLFHISGVSMIEMGILGGQWFSQKVDGDAESERQMLLYDWSYIENDESNHQFSKIELNRLWDLHVKTQMDNTRVLYVPTFYALGQVKKSLHGLGDC